MRRPRVGEFVRINTGDVLNPKPSDIRCDALVMKTFRGEPFIEVVTQVGELLEIPVYDVMEIYTPAETAEKNLLAAEFAKERLQKISR